MTTPDTVLSCSATKGGPLQTNTDWLHTPDRRPARQPSTRHRQLFGHSRRSTGKEREKQSRRTSPARPRIRRLCPPKRRVTNDPSLALRRFLATAARLPRNAAGTRRWKVRSCTRWGLSLSGLWAGHAVEFVTQCGGTGAVGTIAAAIPARRSQYDTSGRRASQRASAADSPRQTRVERQAASPNPRRTA